MRRFGTVLLIGLICLGCASRPEAYWYNPDKTLEEARTDCQACNRQAQAHAQEEHIRRYQDSITHGRPWEMGSEAHEEANRDLDEYNAFIACMNGKGYQRHRELPLGSDLRTGKCFGADRSQHLAGRRDVSARRAGGAETGDRYPPIDVRLGVSPRRD